MVKYRGEVGNIPGLRGDADTVAHIHPVNVIYCRKSRYDFAFRSLYGLRYMLLVL